MTPTFKNEHAYVLLRDKIMRGELPDGCRLPVESRLAAELGIGRVTLRAALEKLEARNLIRRIRGQGTFICYNGPYERPDEASAMIESAPSPRHLKHRLLLLPPREMSESSSGVPIMAGVEARAGELQVELQTIQMEVFCHCFDRKKAAELGRSGGLTGVIVPNHSYRGDEPEIALLRELKLPVLLPFGSDTDAVLEPFLTLDNPIRPAMVTALRCFRAHGHRLVAFIGPFGGDDLHELSPREYRALTDLAAPLFMTADETEKSVGEAVAGVLERMTPTAIFCYNDHYAIWVLAALTRLGIRVPEDVSLMGYGAAAGSAFLTPPLATIDLRLRERGRAAVDYLVSGVTGKLPPPEVGFELLERESIRHITITEEAAR